MKANDNIDIFLVEDDPQYASILKYDLQSGTDYNVTTFTSGEALLKKVASTPDVIILDYFLEGKLNGMEIIKRLKKFNNAIPVIMLSGQEKLQLAVNMVKHGAYDYVIKNESAFIRVKHLIERIIRHEVLAKENASNRKWRTILLTSLGLFAITVIILQFFFPEHYD